MFEFKLPIFICIAILATGINSLQVSDFKNQNILKYANDCSKLFEIDLNEVKNIEENQQEAFNEFFEKSYEHRCFARCMIVRMNLLNQGGKISVAKTYERFPEIDLNIILDVMQFCNEENKNKNECYRLEASDRCICYKLNKIKDGNLINLSKLVK